MQPPIKKVFLGGLLETKLFVWPLCDSFCRGTPVRCCRFLCACSVDSAGWAGVSHRRAPGCAKYARYLLALGKALGVDMFVQTHCRGRLLVNGAGSAAPDLPRCTTRATFHGNSAAAILDGAASRRISR